MSIHSHQPPTRLAVVENAIAASLLALVWLVPNHQLPWSSFHHELLMAIALALFCVLIGWQTRWRLPVSTISAAVLSLALLPWLQWSSGMIPKSGTAFISSAYLVGLSLAIAVGQAGGKETNQRVFHVLFGALALAATLNMIVQMFQWYRWQPDRIDTLLMILVTPVSGGQRPSGMILQPNQLATLQVWGLIGLSWFRYQRILKLPVFLAAFTFICIGIGLTRSRTGLLEILAVTLLLCWVWWKTTPRRDIAFTWVVAFISLIVLELNFVQVTDWLGAGTLAAPSRLSGDDGARLFAWKVFFAVVFESPWTGYGIADLGSAYVALAEKRPELYFGARFVHAHNVILDLLLWVGIPLGLAILAGLSVWFYRKITDLPARPLNAFPFALLMVMGLHTMLELPHHFLYFLIPAGLCVGMLSVNEASKGTLELPRYTWMLSGIVVLVSTGTVARDYFPYQERYTEWRYEHQRVGTRPDIEVHAPHILNQLSDEIALYRISLNSNLSTENLEWIDQTARAVSSPQAFYMAAKAFAFTNHPDQVHSWMMRFNAIMTSEKIEIMRQVWEMDQEKYPELRPFQWPKYKGRGSK